MARYMVTFRFLNKDKDAYMPENWSIRDLEYGFWVYEDEDGLYKITQGGNAQFWIPPSQILLVGKH